MVLGLRWLTMGDAVAAGGVATVCPSARFVAELHQVAAAVLGPRRPEPGERASGHGLSGAIVAVADLQPLAADNIWCIGLAGEPFGRLVGGARGGAWRLLQLDELTDSQCGAYEAGMSGCEQHQGTAQPMTAA